MDRTIKIMHFADTHLDTKFTELDEPRANIRREELRQKFGEFINVAKNDGCDIILIAGDVFDSDRVSRQTIDFILKKLSEIPEIKVFIVAGNHDPYTMNSYYSIIDFPPDVHVFGGSGEAVFLPELNTNVYGVSMTEEQCLFRPLDEFDFSAVDTSKINILLIHALMVNSIGAQDVVQVSEPDIKNTNMDYIALGHIHKFMGIQRAGNVVYAHPGIQEPRGFDETGERGYIAGTIAKGNVDLAFIPFSKRKYITLNVDITGAKTYEEIAGKITAEMGSDSVNLYKVVLIGRTDLKIDTDVVLELVSGERFFVKVKNEATKDYNLDDVAGEYSIKGLFAKEMQTRIKNAKEDEIEVLKAALDLGLEALLQEEV